MEWLIIISLVLSVLNFYFISKKKIDHEQDLKKFQSHTESIMVEFNRITTRNISLLDDKIEELNHKIRLGQKVDLLLKERFEEAHQIDYLSVLQLDKIDNKPISNDFNPKKEDTIKQCDPIKELIIDSIKDLNQQDNITLSTDKELFDNIPINKLKKYQSSQIQNQKKYSLLHHISKNKSKEELLELGFSLNEINLSLLSSNSKQNRSLD